MQTDQQLLIEIKREFTRVHQNSEAINPRNWTKIFLEPLAEIGKREKFNVYPNQESSGWLFDHCWTIGGEGKKWIENFRGFKLICECEWGKSIDRIIYDFQKLTVAVADIRIMIFQYRDENELAEIINACQKASAYTKKDGFRYLLVGSGNDGSDLPCFREI